MAAPYRIDKLLQPGALYRQSTFEDARELADKMVTVATGDELADLIEHAVDKSDRAHAVIMYLVLRARGLVTPTGIQIESEQS